MSYTSPSLPNSPALPVYREGFAEGMAMRCYPLDSLTFHQENYLLKLPSVRSTLYFTFACTIDVSHNQKDVAKGLLEGNYEAEPRMVKIPVANLDWIVLSIEAKEYPDGDRKVKPVRTEQHVIIYGDKERAQEESKILKRFYSLKKTIAAP